MFSEKVQLFYLYIVVLSLFLFRFHSPNIANHFSFKTVFFRLKSCVASHTNKKLERTER